MNYDLKQKFDHYNELLFNSSLPEMPLKFAKLKTVGGCCEYRFMRGNGKTKFDGAKLIPNSMSITISNMYQRDEQGMDGILIHEMIHAFIAMTNDFKETHGRKFMGVLRECSKIVGFPIPVRDSVADLELNDVQEKTIGVTIVQTSRSTYRFALFNEKTLKDNKEAIKSHFSLYGTDIKCFLVKSEEWTKLSIKFPVQRRFGSKTAFYRLDNEKAISELLNNGVKVA